MKVDMSSRAVTVRLKRVSQLRRLCLDLGRARPVLNREVNRIKYAQEQDGIKIEGYTADELLTLPDEQIDGFLLCNEPVAFKIGSAEILGQFRVNGDKLFIELAHIDGGGEGVLPSIWSLAERYAVKKQLRKVEWIVHAVHCAQPNLKLRRLLALKGFAVEQVPGVGDAYHLIRNVAREVEIKSD